MAKIGPKMTKYDVIIKKWLILIEFICRFEAFLIARDTRPNRQLAEALQFVNSGESPDHHSKWKHVVW